MGLPLEMVEGKGGGKQEGMVYWRYCVMDDEDSVGDESPEGNLVSGALDLNFGR
jgi:hypothetical protein